MLVSELYMGIVATIGKYPGLTAMDLYKFHSEEMPYNTFSSRISMIYQAKLVARVAVVRTFKYWLRDAAPEGALVFTGPTPKSVTNVLKSTSETHTRAQHPRNTKGESQGHPRLGGDAILGQATKGDILVVVPYGETDSITMTVNEALSIYGQLRTLFGSQ